MENSQTHLCVDCGKLIVSADPLTCIICEAVICDECNDKNEGCCNKCNASMKSNKQDKGMKGVRSKLLLFLIPILCVLHVGIGLLVFASNLNFVINGTKTSGYVVAVETVVSKIDNTIYYNPSIQFTNKEGKVLVAKSIQNSEVYKNTLHKNLNVYYMKNKPNVVLVSNNETLLVPLIFTFLPILSIGFMVLLIKIYLKSTRK